MNEYIRVARARVADNCAGRFVRQNMLMLSLPMVAHTHRSELISGIPFRGVPRKTEMVPVDARGCYSIIFPARTVPVGKNVFNLGIPWDAARGGGRSINMGIAGNRNRLDVQITPLGQDTLKRVQTPGVPGIPGQSPQSNSLPPDIVPLKGTSGPAAEAVKKSAPSPSAGAIQKKGLSDKAIQAISP